MVFQTANLCPFIRLNFPFHFLKFFNLFCLNHISTELLDRKGARVFMVKQTNKKKLSIEAKILKNRLVEAVFPDSEAEAQNTSNSIESEIEIMSTSKERVDLGRMMSQQV